MPCGRKSRGIATTEGGRARGRTPTLLQTLTVGRERDALARDGGGGGVRIVRVGEFWDAILSILVRARRGLFCVRGFFAPFFFSNFEYHFTVLVECRGSAHMKYGTRYDTPHLFECSSAATAVLCAVLF